MLYLRWENMIREFRSSWSTTEYNEPPPGWGCQEWWISSLGNSSLDNQGSWWWLTHYPSGSLDGCCWRIKDWREWIYG